MRRGAPAVLALAAFACGREESGADVAIQALFAAPASAQCIQIVATGAKRTVTASFDVATGLSTQMLSLQGAPAGTVLFSGNAFAVGCGLIAATAQPTWVADSVVQSLTAGMTATFTMIFRPNGEATVGADFQDDAYTAATIAGSGSAGNVDGVGTAAQFNSPFGVAIGSGVAYVADTGNKAIRKIALATKSVSTLVLAGSSSFVDLRGLTLSGTLLYATDGCAIRKVDLTANTQSILLGDPACSTGATFGTLRGIVVVGSSLFAADSGRNVIRRIDLAGPTASVFSGQSGVAGAADGAAGVALFSAPEGLVADTRFLYLADRGNCTVRQVSQANGSASTLAGLAGACAVVDDIGSAARFQQPSGVAVSGTNLFISDAAGQTLRRIDLSFSAVVSIAGSAGASGNLDGRGSAARFNAPALIAVDSNGVLYVADSGNHEIRSLTK
jgi:hypothetical protein